MGRRGGGRPIVTTCLLISRSTFHMLFVVKLRLRLFLRTNSSYNRFWEGRQLWGSLINETRNLARVVSVHLRTDPALRDSVIRWVGAFPYAVKNVLRQTDGLGPIANELPPAEIAIVERPEYLPGCRQADHHASGRGATRG